MLSGFQLARRTRIKNPLAHVSHDQLIADVEKFSQENGMAELTTLFIRAAQVAKDPPAFESVEGLTEAEKEAIRNEVLHKWRQPKALFFTIILCSIGAAVQGWDQTGSNGANLSFPVAFGINDAQYLGPNNTDPNPDYATNLWLVGLINAGPYIASVSAPSFGTMYQHKCSSLASRTCFVSSRTDFGNLQHFLNAVTGNVSHTQYHFFIFVLYFREMF